MSATVEQASNNQMDHQLNTLTDVIRIVGETRSDVKVIDRKVDRLEQKIDQQGADIAVLKADNEVLKADNEVLKADNAEIKEILKLILSRLPVS